MNIINTNLEGCFLIESTVFEDNRGYFFESFNQKRFNETVGHDIQFVQDNESFSKKGVLRGLHYQVGEYAQAKLVRVIKGRVQDVALDIRQDSPTFGKFFSVELSEANKRQLFIPKGFAHGFLVLSDTAIFSYKCDQYYNKESERGIIFNDQDLSIDWALPIKDLILSDKDLTLPRFKDLLL